MTISGEGTRDGRGFRDDVGGRSFRGGWRNRDNFGGSGRSGGGMGGRISFNSNSKYNSYGDMPSGWKDNGGGSGFADRGGGDTGVWNFKRQQRGRHDEHDEEVPEEKRNGSFRDADRPVQRLIDPTEVPKGRFFDHDDRSSESGSRHDYGGGRFGREDRNRGRPYDPRDDRDDYRNNRNKARARYDDNERDGGRRGGGRFREKERGGWDGFGNEEEKGYRRDRFERSYERHTTGADGIWTHDLFDEFGAGDSGKKNGNNVLVDSGHVKRRIHSDD